MEAKVEPLEYLNHITTQELVVDAHLQTSIPRLYAAGDIVSGLKSHGAIAATAINTYCSEDLSPN
jgi:thioredoxin reductase